MSRPFWERRPYTTAYVPVVAALALTQFFYGWPL